MAEQTRGAALATPEAGAPVMGTGIVSIALVLDGAEVPSRVLLAIAALMYVIVAGSVTLRMVRDGPQFRRELRAPAALSWVAASAVVGTRLALLGWTGPAVALLAVAVALWCGLIGPVLRHWRTPTTGGSLLLTVGTQALAVLAALLAGREHVPWLLDGALVPFVLGLASYPFVLARFDSRQLRVGRGDQWIAGGALAISTLACANLADSAHSLGILGHGAALKDVAVGLWVASMLWLPVLVVGEVIRPWRGHHPQRFSTVFPLGMYAACSFVVGTVARAGAISSFARVWVWIAAAVWAVVFAASVGAAFSARPGHRAAG